MSSHKMKSTFGRGFIDARSASTTGAKRKKPSSAPARNFDKRSVDEMSRVFKRSTLPGVLAGYGAVIREHQSVRFDRDLLSMKTPRLFLQTSRCGRVGHRSSLGCIRIIGSVEKANKHFVPRLLTKMHAFFRIGICRVTCRIIETTCDEEP